MIFKYIPIQRYSAYHYFLLACGVTNVNMYLLAISKKPQAKTHRLELLE